jgi:light-regulated signal transduction histidine kinase (bacteriophytochrome)
MLRRAFARELQESEQLFLAQRKVVEARLEKQADELRQSNADLQRFAYVASHDLQEPLRMVTMFMQLVADRHRGKLGAETDEFIGYAVDGANRMRQLITDLLAYSRVGSAPRDSAPTDCAEILRTALMNLDVLCKERGAIVTYDSLPRVMADRSHLLQLFQNLISNAIKFTVSEPRIHVAAERMGDDWLFTVQDNGIGISPDHYERIFTMFTRLHDRATYPGTGIGLAICQRIVERHGGRIWVNSRIGVGSTFNFTLPSVSDRKESQLGNTEFWAPHRDTPGGRQSSGCTPDTQCAPVTAAEDPALCGHER